MLKNIANFLTLEKQEKEMALMIRADY